MSRLFLALEIVFLAILLLFKTFLLVELFLPYQKDIFLKLLDLCCKVPSLYIFLERDSLINNFLLNCYDY